MDNGSREIETKYEKEMLEIKDIVTQMKTHLRDSVVSKSERLNQ